MAIGQIANGEPRGIRTEDRGMDRRGFEIEIIARVELAARGERAKKLKSRHDEQRCKSSFQNTPKLSTSDCAKTPLKPQPDNGPADLLLLD